MRCVSIAHLQPGLWRGSRPFRHNPLRNNLLPDKNGILPMPTAFTVTKSMQRERGLRWRGQGRGEGEDEE